MFFIVQGIPLDAGQLPHPSHPIMLPGMPGWGSGGQPRPPLGIWGPGFPYPDQGLPGNQPYPDQGLPGNQPYPDQGLPGSQPRPDNTLPMPPLVIWGPNDPRPGWGLPELPPEITPPPAQGAGGEPVPVVWKSGWTQTHGWVVVGIPTVPIPTPSK